MVLHAHAVYQTAALAYERAIRLEPKEFAWRYYYASVVWQLSGPEKAMEPLSAALRLRPGYAPAILKKGDLLYQLGNFQESGEAYKSVLAEDPASAAGLYGMARVKYAQHDTAAAEDFYSRACRAYSNYGAAYYGLATVEQGLGRDAEAAKNFELAQRYNGDHPPATDPLGDQLAALETGIYYRLANGDQLARKGRTDEAAQLNEAMLARDPENFSVLLNLLYLARFVDRLSDKVEGWYLKAKQINPQVALVYAYYGAALARQGKFDVAAAAARKAIELQPDYPEAHVLLGEVLEQQSHPAEALEQYQRALATQSSDRTLQLKLWRLLIIQGRGRDAIPQLIPALQVDDTYATLRRLLLGEAYLTTGDIGKAQEYLEQARSRARTEGPPELVAQIDQEIEQIARRR
jgi:tetratricopeptide (TPR) repeat protein